MVEVCVTIQSSIMVEGCLVGSLCSRRTWKGWQNGIGSICSCMMMLKLNVFEKFTTKLITTLNKDCNDCSQCAMQVHFKKCNNVLGKDDVEEIVTFTGMFHRYFHTLSACSVTRTSSRAL